MSGTETVALSIEDLSHATGVTTRNIRAYQTQGLLSAPVRQGRASVYDAEHLAQLEMIRDLRDQGIGLPAIERLIDWGKGIPAGELRAFASTLLQGLILETPEVVPVSDATEVWADQVTPDLMERSLATGFFRVDDDGTLLVLSPTLRAHGAELREIGVTFEEAIEMTEALHEHLDAIAVTFTEIFSSRVTTPAVDGAEDRAAALREISAVVERVQPMAVTAVNAAFRLVMQHRVEEALEATLADSEDPEGSH